MNTIEFKTMMAKVNANAHLFSERAPKTWREYAPTKEQLKALRETQFSEINYIEYREDGLVMEGTEDFSLERWRGYVVSRGVFTPTGKLNRAGQTRWEFSSEVTAHTAKACGEIAKLKYEGTQISMRKSYWVS